MHLVITMSSSGQRMEKSVFVLNRKVFYRFAHLGGLKGSVDLGGNSRYVNAIVVHAKTGDPFDCAMHVFQGKATRNPCAAITELNERHFADTYMLQRASEFS